MKTIIWKELRENLKWAALAVLCLTLAEIYALYQGRYVFSAYNGEFTLCDSTFLLVSALGCSVIGGALAGVQILPELRRDQWAALLHRPVPRGTIFFGKVVAGLLLYLLATSIPFLLSIAYVATPRQFAVPFIPRMAIPGASDILLGVAVYCATLLVSLSQGPWYGRRALLALSVVPLIFFHIVVGWFSPSLITALIFITAAYGAMLSNGNDHRAPLMARICSVIVMLAGVQTVAILLVAALSFLPGAADKFSHDGGNRYFQIAKDGSVFLSNYDGLESELTDLNGKPVTDERYLGNNSGSNFTFLITMFWNRRRDQFFSDTFRKQHPRFGNNYIDQIEREADAPECWFLDVRKNYLIGYDKMSRRCVGICDRDGFHPADAVPHPFPQPIASPFYSRNGTPWLGWVGNQLYGIDFAERTLSPLFNSGEDKIYGAVQLTSPPTYKPFYIAVGLEKEIRVLDLTGNLLLTIPYAHDVDQLPHLEICTVPSGDRIFVVYSTPQAGKRKPDEIEPLSFLEEIDFHGHVVHSYSAMLGNSSLMIPGWVTRAAFLAYPMMPLALHELYKPSDASASDDEYSAMDNSIMKFSPGGTHLPITLLLGLSILLGIIAFLWANQVGLEKRASLGWSIFVLCFGLPGLITFRLASHWPTRVPCPTCSHKRPIGTEECPSCHQAWPPPKSNGTEIFADSTC